MGHLKLSYLCMSHLRQRKVPLISNWNGFCLMVSDWHQYWVSWSDFEFDKFMGSFGACRCKTLQREASHAVPRFADSNASILVKLWRYNIFWIFFWSFSVCGNILKNKNKCSVQWAVVLKLHKIWLDVEILGVSVASYQGVLCLVSCLFSMNCLMKLCNNRQGLIPYPKSKWQAGTVANFYKVWSWCEE